MSGRLIVCLTMLIAVVGEAQDTAIPPGNPDPLMLAVIEIGLSPEQRPAFQEVVSGFVTSYRAAVRKISLGANVTDVDRRVERKRTSLAMKMDEQMMALLSAAQMQRYGLFRKQLLERLTQQPDPLSGESYDRLEPPPAIHH